MLINSYNQLFREMAGKKGVRISDMTGQYGSNSGILITICFIAGSTVILRSNINKTGKQAVPSSGSDALLFYNLIHSFYIY